MTDELTFLRALERTLTDAQRTDSYNESMMCVAEARIKTSQRIIELLKAQLYPGQQELADIEQAEGTAEFVEGAGLFHDNLDAYEERQDALIDAPCEFNEFWGNRCINPDRRHAEKHHND